MPLNKKQENTGVHRIRPEIQTLRAYTVQASDGLIKLDAMENPYSWPKHMRDEWLDQLRDVPLNRYPDASGSELKQHLRQTMNIPQQTEILLGNGSDELIQIVQLCLSGPGGAMLAPAPSFVMYEMTARFVGARYFSVPLCSDFSLDLDAMCNAIRKHNPSVVFLAYPNNPTGNLFDRAAVDEIIRVTNGLVVLDEAYYIFAHDSYYDQIERHDNLVVMRTLSKLGLAGLRLGFLVGPAPWVGQFEKVRMPYNVGALTQRTAAFALQKMNVFKRQAEFIVAERERVYAALRAMPELTPFTSQTNFILFRSAQMPAAVLFQKLVERGILIKNFHHAGTVLHQCLRVSIGTQDENDKFLQAVDECLR